MKILHLVIASLFIFVCHASLAHEDHSHQLISEAQALTAGASAAAQLSREDKGLDIGKLPENWATIPKENISIHKTGEGYYIVAVKNTLEKKTLYVLISFQGEIYDANFSGVFKGLK